jgi:archaellum component FlaC
MEPRERNRTLSAASYASEASADMLGVSQSEDDDDDEPQNLWTVVMTVTCGEAQIPVIGALAQYGANSLQTDARGVKIVPAGRFLKTHEFTNGQAMRGNAVCLPFVRTGRVHRSIMTRVRAAENAGASVALVAKPDSMTLLPRSTPTDDGSGISIPVVVVPTSFKEVVANAYDEEETLYLRCTSSPEFMAVGDYKEHASAALMPAPPEDQLELESELEQPEPEPEPEPETQARVSFDERLRASRGWVEGYDNIDAASRLYKTTTRSEVKVTDLHERYPEASKEDLARALEEAHGNIDRASALLADWSAVDTAVARETESESESESESAPEPERARAGIEEGVPRNTSVLNNPASGDAQRLRRERSALASANLAGAQLREEAIHLLQARTKAADTALRQEQHAKAELKRELKAVKRELNTARSEMERLGQEHQDVVFALEADNQELADAHERASHEVADLLDEVADLSAEVAELRSFNHDHRFEQENLTTQLRQLQQENAGMKRQLREVGNPDNAFQERAAREITAWLGQAHLPLSIQKGLADHGRC